MNKREDKKYGVFEHGRSPYGLREEIACTDHDGQHCMQHPPNRGFMCTLPKGHTGDHVAGTLGKPCSVFARWKQEEVCPG